MRLGDLDALKADLIQDYAYAAASIVDKAPTIDAVEVVRCKDCKHWVKKGFQAGNDINHMEYGGHCPYGIGARYESDFCSLGERKGGDG